MKNIRGFLFGVGIALAFSASAVVYNYFSPGGALTGNATAQSVDLTQSGFVFGPLRTGAGGTGTNSALTGVLRGGNPFTASELSGDCTTLGSNVITCTQIKGITPGGTCTNQAVTAISTSAVPTCTTLTSSYVNNSIALTGVDISTANQVTNTHLAAPLPINQGGTGTTSTLTGLLRGSASAMTAAELSGDATTSGSNAVTIATNAVTNAKLAQMSANTLKCNNTGVTANALDCTIAQVQALLSIPFATDVQTFTSSGTWIKPTNGTPITTETICYGGGGGGGSGAESAALAADSGGGGGGGGGPFDFVFPTSNLGATETVTIGAGGTAGAAASSAGNGNAGGIGGTTTFGTWATAFGGGGGGPGQQTTNSGGGGGAGLYGAGSSGAGNSGGAAGNTGGGNGGSGATGAQASFAGSGGGGGVVSAAGATGAHSPFPSGIGGGAGGGAGGGTSVAAAFAGGNGGRSALAATAATGGALGTSGTAGGAGITPAGYGVGNSGAGGGAGSAGTGGAGGAGGRGSGGGGGGASVGANSGAGGIGGNGFCAVLTFY